MLKLLHLVKTEETKKETLSVALENIIYYCCNTHSYQLIPYLYAVDFIFYNCFSPGLNWLGLFVKHKLKSNFMLKYMDICLIFVLERNGNKPGTKNKNNRL